MGRAYRATLLVVYQLTLLVGIAALPVAVLARQVGLRLPVGRAVERLGEKYEQTTSA
ncbi:MAG: hypothetical protein ABEH61_04525 [Haloarculaceae archaeon]